MNGQATMHLIRLLDRWLEETLITLLGSVMVVCLSYTAFVRYFTTHPKLTSLSHVAEELAVFSFVGLLYFGSVLATREGKHFRVSAQFSLLPKRWHRWRFALGDALWLAFNLFVVWQGVELVRQTMQRSEPSLSLGIPMQYIYAIIPIAFGLTALRLVQTYFKGTQDREESDDLIQQEEKQ